MSTSTVRSKDGTVIAFDVWGEGQPLIMIDGATAHRQVNPTNAATGQLLADEFRAVAYDRRGRGESTDTAPYSVEREIDDLAALIAHAGGPAVLFGWSAGAVLALDAAAAGLPVVKLALFEPPVIADDSRPPQLDDYIERLERFLAEGRPGDAAELFLIHAAGMPGEVVAGIKQSPFWPALEAAAPTLPYDARIMNGLMSGRPLPRDRWANVEVPILVMHGDATEPWLAAGARAVAELLPTATLAAVPGQQHSTTADVLAAELRKFACAS